MTKGEEGNGVLTLDEPFDRAWRRVGLALDRVGFTVEDRDRAKGLYYVRYVDPKTDGKKSDGLVRTFFSVRHATPLATGQSLMSAPASRSAPTTRARARELVALALAWSDLCRGAD